MIGGGNLAYLMLGLKINEDNVKKTHFLILDPHYKGDDRLESILSKKANSVYWTTIDHFSNKGFYNLCLPLYK